MTKATLKTAVTIGQTKAKKGDEVEVLRTKRKLAIVMYKNDAGFIKLENLTFS